MRLHYALSALLLLLMAPRAVAQPVDPGPRLQLVNLVPASDALDLAIAPEAVPLVSTDTFGRRSDPVSLPASTRRVVVSSTLGGVRSVILDTTLAADDSAWYYAIAYLDPTMTPRVRLLRRDRVRPVAGTRSARVLHLGAGLGSVALRLEGDLDGGLLEIASAPFGALTAQRVIRNQSVRLRLLPSSGGAVLTFVVPMSGPEIFTLVVTGSVGGGDLRAWVLEDEPVPSGGSVQWIEEGRTGRGARVVNLFDRAIDVESQWMSVDGLLPRSVTRVDDDIDRDSVVTIDVGLPQVVTNRIDSRTGFTKTILMLPWGESSYRMLAIADTSSFGVATDSASVRFANTSLSETYRLHVPGAAGSSVVTYFSARSTVPAGTRRFIIERARGDTPFASIDVPLLGGTAVTVIVHLEGSKSTALMLIDSDRDEHALLPLRVVPYASSMPPTPTGELLVVNATLGADSVGAILDASYIVIGSGNLADRRSIEPGTRAELVWAGSGSSARTLAERYHIGIDSTTMLLVVGEAPSTANRLLELQASRHYDTSRPALRLVNALFDERAIDVITTPGLSGVPEQRVFPFEAVEHRATSMGAMRLEVQNPNGSILFRADDSLLAKHRYTAIITGTLASPRVFIADEDLAGDVQALRVAIITRPDVSGVAAAGIRRGPRVSPNPARTSVSIDAGSAEAATRVDLVDPLGRTVLVSIEVARPVDLSAIAAGSYTLVARDGGRIIWRERIVVVR